MKIKLDKETDVKYIALTKTRRKGVVASTKKIKNWLLVDYSKTGDLLGIEILNASKNKGVLILRNNEVSYQSDSRPIMFPNSTSYPVAMGRVLHGAEN